MNNVDKQYLSVLKDILENGYEKKTRSGDVLSLFGKSMRFNLQEGFPLLTTKKMFYKGFIHELLWFLSGSTNIRYLVENNVNFWTPDAYRFYTELIGRNNKINHSNTYEIVSYEEFVENVKNVAEPLTLAKKKNDFGNTISMVYNWGDLGPVYGKQWRMWGSGEFDQINYIIKTLKKNPDDRRLLLTGYNPSVLNEIALPPCHTLYQFYSRELTSEEMEKHPGFTRALSLWFSCRSQDMPLGNPANIMSAALLVSMVAQCVGMMPDELIWQGGDCHIYKNQIEGIKEQLSRDPEKYSLPKLVLNPDIHDIDCFTFEDINIEGYESYPTIKMPLSVG